MEETMTGLGRAALCALLLVAAFAFFSPAAEAQVVVVTPNGYGYAPTTSDQLAPPPSAQLAAPELVAEADAPRTRANGGLILGGAISLGIGYVSNAIGSTLWSLNRAIQGIPNTDEFFVFGLVPVVGPWAQLAFSFDDTERALLIVSGVAQAAGLTMLIAGLTWARKPVNEIELAGGARIGVTPTAGASSVGLTAYGSF
jgi:hypothetical protein